MRVVLLVLLGLLTAGSAVAGTRTVFAVNIGWHVGLAFASEDIDPTVFPEIADLDGAPWIEVGWGDEAFYQDPNPSLGVMLDAALVPTPAVIHLVGMPAEPARYLPQAETLAIELSPEAFARLVAHVAAAVVRNGAPRAEAIGAGLYPVSRFYPAEGSFSLRRTCNTWAAEALAAAGVAVDPEGVVRASTLMSRLRAALGLRPPQGERDPSDFR